MTRSSRKRRAAYPSCKVSEVVSPGNVEFVSVDIFDRKVTKKRVIERVPLNRPPPTDGTPVSAGDTKDILLPVGKPKGPSRSASVSVFLSLAPIASNR